jgi:tRNA threonylcarbamoyladenosine biosynthesis protein TsaB
MRSASKMLLAIDTSSRQVSIALYEGNQVLCEFTWNSRDYHTVELAPAVEEIFSRSDVQVSELGAIAVATGPGSFTGLRIGLAFAKGLSLALRIPLIGVPTLDILAVAQPISQSLLIAVLRAGRDRLAVGYYRVSNGRWISDGSFSAMTIDELNQQIQSPSILCGEFTPEEVNLLARRYKNVILASPAQSLRRASFLAEIGWQRWQTNDIDDPISLSPFYLHYNDPISI